MTEKITHASLCRGINNTEKHLIILSVLMKLEKEGLIISEMESAGEGCNGERKWVRTYKPIK